MARPNKAQKSAIEAIQQATAIDGLQLAVGKLKSSDRAPLSKYIAVTMDRIIDSVISAQMDRRKE